MAASGSKDEVQSLMKDLDQAATVYADNSDNNARRNLRDLALKLALRLESVVESHDRTLFEVSAHGVLLSFVPRASISNHAFMCFSPTEAQPSASH